MGQRTNDYILVAIRSGIRIQIGIRVRIATLVRRGLVEVCTVPVLIVMYQIIRVKQNWRQFLFVVKVTALNQQI